MVSLEWRLSFLSFFFFGGGEIFKRSKKKRKVSSLSIAVLFFSPIFHPPHFSSKTLTSIDTMIPMFCASQ